MYSFLYKYMLVSGVSNIHEIKLLESNSFIKVQGYYWKRALFKIKMF